MVGSWGLGLRAGGLDLSVLAGSGVKCLGFRAVKCMGS